MDAGKIVTEFCAAWGRGDKSAIVDAFADDAVYHNIPMPPNEGKEAIAAFIEGFIGTMATDISFEIRHQLVSGNLVMNERVDKMTIGGNAVALPVCGVFEIGDDGKIKAWRDYFDAAQFSG